MMLWTYQVARVDTVRHRNAAHIAQHWARHLRLSLTEWAPETDINTALEAAADAAGLSLKNAEHLSEQLRSNWYSTAGDVAQMSKEELQQMQIPVRVWAMVKAMVAADSAAAAAASAAAADSLEDRASSELAATTAAGSAAVELQQGDATGEVDATTSAAGQELHPDIMQRRMPRNFVGTNSAGSTRVQVTSKKAVKPYALKDEQLSAALREELSQLERFCCGTFYGQRVEPLRPVSFNVYREELWRMLGWAHTERGVPLEQLRLATLVPSPGREGVSLLMDYQHWRQQKGVTARSHLLPIKATIVAARLLYHEQSSPSAKPPYRDLGVMQELALMLRNAHKAAAHAPLVADESKKWLQWDEFTSFVQALRAECAGLTATGQPRVRREVACSLQRYLIVAILSVVPDRQRTLRELEVGRTLLQQADGSWVIKHAAADYKTGKKYGDRPPLLIAPFIYPELEAFIGTWRQELAPKTSMLFCKPRSGEALDVDAVTDVFKKAALRLTGKATHPHLVRDMIVTHLRESGASEQDMESLALLMGHSVKEQRGTYDRRTKAQKVQPAVDLMLELADVEAAVAAALAKAGRAPGPAEVQLVQRLRANLYNTAGDVAAMSQEELELVDVPAKLAFILRQQLQRQGQQAQQQPTAQQELIDIMQRRMPAYQQPLSSIQKTRVRSSPLQSLEPYSLQEAHMPSSLQAELAALERFCTTRFFGQMSEPLQPVTYRSVTKHYVKLLLGFAHNVRGVPLEQLRLATLVPSPGREGVSLLMDYQHWRQQERGTASSTATIAIKAVVHVARFLYHDLAKPCAETKLRPYHDLEVVQELNAMQRTASKAAGRAARVADDSKKWLEWPDYLKMVSALRAECAGLTEAGKPRPRSQVAISLQRYLIVAILSVVPDRQRTLRELEVGRTLLQQADGSWVIKHAAADYKTGKQYGDRPPLLIAPFIYPELEAFIGTWRQELAPKTSMLFCKPRTGQPLDESAVYLLCKSAALRLTGKATHPHLVRDMIVTHLRMQRRSEAELEALALYMGHSLEMQRGTYDRRSKDQKVAPAQQLLQQLARQGKKGD
ncbi:hypothetical protein OEZ86_000602 [Tetradesmus obliquus]|nr:hypothetical protein OEZ86_000602 [Tetradesmus obliquus]